MLNITLTHKRNCKLLPLTVGIFHFFFQVNGVDTVRVPVSLLPFEDPSASYQRLLKKKRQEQAAADTSEAVNDEKTVLKAADAAVEAEAGKDSGTHVREVSDSEGAAATEETTAQTTQDTTAPPSDSPPKN